VLENLSLSKSPKFSKFWAIGEKLKAIPMELPGPSIFLMQMGPGGKGENMMGESGLWAEDYTKDIHWGNHSDQG
jgi:hypothetical protein